MDDDAPDSPSPPPALSTTFIPPSVDKSIILSGSSHTHFSPVPPSLQSSSPDTPAPPCVLGVDEAGRGPVLGPMVYGVFYLPIGQSDPLLRDTHHFDDSKVLKPEVRSSLMQTLCTPDTDLHTTCGWATAALSARDISAGMLRPAAINLNSQAFDATIELIRGVYARGVNVQEIYVDTVGPPAAYQARLQRFFPSARITVAKKADSLYPCVSAASVCAKVTRDTALEVLYEERGDGAEVAGWGSGYPSDARCVSWLKANMHPVFGWGPECRFSWGTAKDLVEGKNGAKVDWPEVDDGEAVRLTDYFSGTNGDASELGGWFGSSTSMEAF